MLRIEIPSVEVFDEETSTFSDTAPVVLSLEHSLMSVSKWESRWCVPFLSKDEKTSEQMRDYVRCMTITQNVPPSVYDLLTLENVTLITAYIEAPMTATIITQEKSGKSRERVTSEVIYSWMVLLNIPFDPAQKWHLNRLLTLIAICNEKQKPPNKLKGKALLKQNSEINKQRRALLNSAG